jgi:hypothetical protein
MIKGGSKRKGSSFEREISVNLSLWHSSNTREDVFWRSSMSGGRATVARKKQKELKTQAGDLSAIHPSGQVFLDVFYVELKFYRDLNYSGLVTGTGHLVKFWKSTITEANSYRRSPMLITKQNRSPVVIYLQVMGLRRLRLHIEQAIISSPRLGMYGYLLDDFIKCAKPL